MDALFPGLDAAPNAHPLFVHFPIVLSLVALLFWATGALHRRSDLFTMGTWLLGLAVVSAGATLVSGFVAVDGLGHESPGHERVHDHRDLMLIASGLLAATLGAAWLLRRRAKGALRWSLVAALLAVNVVIAMGADRGALAVYGYRIGTRDVPPAARVDEHHHHHDETPENEGDHEHDAVHDDHDHDHGEVGHDHP